MTIDIGSGVLVRPYSCARHGEHGGLVIIFRGSGCGETDCSGTVSICGCSGGGGRTWRMTSVDPLTLEPSIQCTIHPRHHGWIRNGRWVPA